MAIQKEITTSFGIVANYHKIHSFTDDKINRVVTITVNSYIDLTYKDKTPIGRLVFVSQDNNEYADFPYSFSCSEIDPEGMNHIKKAYNLIKTTEAFIGAIDV